MVSKKVVVRNKSGLHMRPASELCNICKNYDCEISIKHPKGCAILNQLLCLWVLE